jgi:hypothetical protein
MTTLLCSQLGHVFKNVFYDYNHEEHVFYNYDVCTYMHENMVNRLLFQPTSRGLVSLWFARLKN